MPTAVHPLINAMSQHDWLLVTPATRESSGRFWGMAARRPVAAKIGTAARLLPAHFDRFSDDFDEFLPDLRARCGEFLTEHDHTCTTRGGTLPQRADQS